MTAKRRLDEYGRAVLLELAPRWSKVVFMGTPVEELDLTIDELKGLSVLMWDMGAYHKEYGANSNDRRNVAMGDGT